MKRKPFWKRCNRGFVVFLGLLAAVLVYVLVTQLMLIPERQDIQKLAEEYRGYMESTSQLSDDQIASLKDGQAMKNETDQLKEKLTPLFDKDSNYVDTAVQFLYGNITMQTQDIQHFTSLSDAKITDSSCTIDQDIATYAVTYSYTVSGSFYDYKTQDAVHKEDVQQLLKLTVNCRKTDGQWKIYRISQAEWTHNDTTAIKGADQQ